MVTHLDSSDSVSENAPHTLPWVVGIGASAGGLRSVETLLRSLSFHPETVLVIVQHMSPDANSSMEEILSRSTDLEVITVEQEMPLQPNCAFLIPPGKEIRLVGDRFQLSDLDREQIARPIDTFFQSLAEGYGERAIGVILSGTGSDGSDGIEKIHRMGGTTVVESLKSAQFDGMPRNAMATNCIDMVMTPQDIGEWLGRQFGETNEKRAPARELGEDELSGVNLIFSLLSEAYEIEFSFYRPGTVSRRIERRRIVNDKKSTVEYANFLRNNAEELEALYHDLLIGVTKFFRDTEAFAALEKQIKSMVELLPENEELRIWVAGCATGEEPYSIAMLCREAFDLLEREPRFKIFATDAHGGSLDTASRGLYNSASLEFVSLARQQTFFSQESKDRFRVNSELRRHIVFARHNVFQDPPYTKMDLVTCRNLLIYLKNEAQQKAIASFHFALNLSGILMLGSSESPGKLGDEFEDVDELWKIYRKLRNVKSPIRPMAHNSEAMLARPRKLVNLLNSDRPEAMSFTGLIESYDLLLAEFVESGILLDDKRNILHIFGDANKYLKNATGRFTGSLMGFLDGNIKASIAAALIRAAKEMGKKIVLENFELTLGNDPMFADVTVKALPGHSASSFVWFVTFAKPQNATPSEKVEVEEEGDTIKVKLSQDAYAAMESELIYTKESLCASIEQLEVSNEELQASNEQLVAANEELQSTNEELHSVNEELYSVNAENQRKIGDLEEMTDDVDNLLASTDVGIVLLDKDLNIRKFTNAASNYIKLLPSDVGRNVTDFAMHLKQNSLYQHVAEVLSSGNFYSAMAETKSGSQVLVRVSPYWSNNKIKGVIINFIEMNENAYPLHD